MTFADDLGPDVVELAPCLQTASDVAAPRLREVAFRAAAWLPEEDLALRQMFVADAAIAEISGRLGRPFQGVRARIGALGLRRNSQRPWLPEEEAELLARYGAEPCAPIARDLGRSVASVYGRAQLLGLAREIAADWDEWEDQQLQAGYEAGVPCGQLAALIGRPLIGVRSRAHALGLRHPSQPPGWSDAEVNRALELAEEGHRYLAIVDMLADEGFPRRTKLGLAPVLHRLGYGRGWGRKWSDDEIELLRQTYARSESVAKLAASFGRTRTGVMKKADELGLRGTHKNRDGFRQGPVWTPEEDAFLRENYGKMGTAELAAKLGRPKGGVFQRAWKQLGLVHGYWRPYTEQERQAFRIAYDEGLSIADLAIALERHPMTVSKYATDKLEMHFGRRRRRKPPLTLAEITALDPGAPIPVPRSKSIGRPRGGDRSANRIPA